MKYNQNELKNSTICAQMWFGSVIEADGSFAMCCEITDTLPDTSIEKHTISEIQFHPKIVEIRNKMLNGERPKECWRCFEKEDNNLKSLRHELNNFYFSKHDNFNSELIQAENIELRLGNLCQLQCVMCHPIRSYKINNFIKFSNAKNVKLSKFTKPINENTPFKWVESEECWKK